MLLAAGHASAATFYVAPNGSDAASGTQAAPWQSIARAQQAAAPGVILGQYSNGKSRPLGQIVLVNFANPDGLTPLGNNAWAESSASGTPQVGTPGTGSNGQLRSASVETSNVDLTAELVNMITAQRVYQANSQTIKTQDQVLQTLVNLR
eukprot:gene23837-26973_t